MVNPKNGEFYGESNYEGYGEFGGKDYYELLAELNGKTTRHDGIDIAYSGEKYTSPILVECLENWKRFIGQVPEECEEQGYFY